MTKKIELWLCEGCGTRYPCLEDAKTCEEGHRTPVALLSAEAHKGKTVPPRVVILMDDGEAYAYDLAGGTPLGAQVSALKDAKPILVKAPA